MSQSTKELKSELEKSVAHLQTLRDEVRAKLRKATIEAKGRWKKLEPELEALEPSTKDVSDAPRAAAAKGVHALREFLTSL
jgi:hypothetical protein